MSNILSLIAIQHLKFSLYLVGTMASYMGNQCHIVELDSVDENRFWAGSSMTRLGHGVWHCVCPGVMRGDYISLDMHVDIVQPGVIFLLKPLRTRRLHLRLLIN